MQPNKRLKVVLKDCRKEESNFNRDRRHRGLTVFELPIEILEYIFRYFYYVVRQLVKRKFLSLEKLIEHDLKYLEQTHLMSYNDMESYYSVATQVFKLESLKFHYKLIRAVVWRYVLVPNARCSFYGGQIIDVMMYMLHPRYKHNYGITTIKNDVTTLQSLVKKFCNHFERHYELMVNDDYTVSGSKLVDLLDCIITPEVNKTVFRSHVSRSGSKCVYAAQYRFPRTWFTCIQKIKNTFVVKGRPHRDSVSWSTKQRFMFLRIRRIVFNYNIFSTRQQFYDIMNLIKNIYIPRNELSISSYSGFGENDGKFFYYGCMTEDNYNVKFIPNFQLPHQQPEDDAFEEDEVFIGEGDELLEEPGIENTNQVLPKIILYVSIELIAPMSLAPLEIIIKYKKSKPQDMMCILEKEKCKHASVFHLHMKVECLASKENRLPHVCNWHVCSTKCVSNIAV